MRGRLSVKQSVGERIALPRPVRWMSLATALILLAGTVFLLDIVDRLKEAIPVSLGTSLNVATTRGVVSAILLVLGCVALRRGLYSRKHSVIP